jgi:transcriptional regulator with XRE-family HTH domain
MGKRKNTRSYEDFLGAIVKDDPEVADHLSVLRPRTRMAAALARVRSTLRLTQRDVASRMDIPQSNVARMECPLGNLQTTEALLAYAEACGLKLGVVFLEKSDDTFAIREATVISSDDAADRFLQSLKSGREAIGTSPVAATN